MRLVPWSPVEKKQMETEELGTSGGNFFDPVTKNICSGPLLKRLLFSVAVDPQTLVQGCAVVRLCNSKIKDIDIFIPKMFQIQFPPQNFIKQNNL